MNQALVDEAINFHGPGLVDALHEEQVCILIVKPNNASSRRTVKSIYMSVEEGER